MSELRKLVVEVDFTIETGIDGKPMAVFTHPDLEGKFLMKASSREMLKVQMEHLNAAKTLSTDPISVLVNSASKLVESARELKELTSKK